MSQERRCLVHQVATSSGETPLLTSRDLDLPSFWSISDTRLEVSYIEKSRQGGACHCWCFRDENPWGAGTRLTSRYWTLKNLKLAEGKETADTA